MNDSELNQLLKLSDINTPLHAGFQRQVWLRITAVEAASCKNRIYWLIEWFLDSIARPQATIATCAAMVTVGIWIGLASENSTSQAKGEMAYIQAISPFSQNHR